MKDRYLDCYITTIRIFYEKDGHCGRQACFIEVEGTVSLWKYIFSINKPNI